MVKVLVVIPYRDLFPPRSGGSLRAFFLLRELCRVHEVHAVIFQPEEELRRDSSGLRFPQSLIVHEAPIDLRNPNGKLKRIRNALLSRWLLRSTRLPTQSILLWLYPTLKRVLSEHRFDVVILEHLTAMLAAPIIARADKRTRQVLLAHNVDHVLEMKNNGAGKKFDSFLWLESNLARFVHAFLTCSDHDTGVLAELNPSCAAYTIPNGVDTEYRAYDSSPVKRDSQRPLFCGSLGYEPNIEGLTWFLSEVWPGLTAELPSTRLTVIGAGTPPEQLATLLEDDRIDLHCNVDDVAPFYRDSALSIVPLLSGSGTRHKIFESMSFGCPTVSTNLGAQGIEVEHRWHLLLADSSKDFASCVREALTAKGLYETLRREARTLVKNRYEWKVIGARYCEVIEEIAKG